MPALYVVHIGNAESAAQLLGWNFHWPWPFGLAGRGLREGSRKSSVKGDVAFHFLHGLMDVSVQHGHGPKFF